MAATYADTQARERSWRIGQKRDVVIYRLICKGTIEERIYERQIFKLLLSSRILQNAKQKALLSRFDFKQLFELRDDDDDDAELPAAGNVEVGGHHRRGLPDDSADGKELRVLRALFDGNNVAAVYDHNYLEAQITNEILTAAEAKSTSDIVERAKQKLMTSSRADSSLQYTILKRLQTFFETNRVASTQTILDEFRDIEAEHAPIFREMLCKVARNRNGKWIASQS
jgi:hypothetical protein